MKQDQKTGIVLPVKMLKLTKLSDEPVIFNWSNVISISNVNDSFGNEYSKVVVVGGKSVAIKEDLSEIEYKIN